MVWRRSKEPLCWNMHSNCNMFHTAEMKGFRFGKGCFNILRSEWGKTKRHDLGMTSWWCVHKRGKQKEWHCRRDKIWGPCRWVLRSCQKEENNYCHYRSIIVNLTIASISLYLFSIAIVKSQITQAQGFLGHFPPSAWLYGAADLCLRKLGWSEEPWQNDRHRFFWVLEQWNNGGSMVDSRLMMVNSD